MALYQVKRAYQNLPDKIKKFLIRAIILFVGWLAVYHLILKPINFPDQQLTDLIKWGTARFLALFYPDIHIGRHVVNAMGQDTLVDTAFIFTGNRSAIGIAPECNGLELIALYWGFMICMPTTLKRFLVFAIVGFVIICVLNVLRCAGLAWMNLNENSLFDLAHHFIFKLVIYGVVFWLWMIYSKKFTVNNGRRDVVQA